MIGQAINAICEIRTKKQAFSDNFQVSNPDGVEISIVGSLAGGTGSGTFLDVAFSAQRYLNTFAKITGVFILPRVFANLSPNTMVKSNAYGALKEIKYLWGVTPSNTMELDYGGFKVKAERPLFDTVFVIDAINK